MTERSRRGTQMLGCDHVITRWCGSMLGQDSVLMRHEATATSQSQPFTLQFRVKGLGFRFRVSGLASGSCSHLADICSLQSMGFPQTLHPFTLKLPQLKSRSCKPSSLKEPKGPQRSSFPLPWAYLPQA